MFGKRTFLSFGLLILAIYFSRKGQNDKIEGRTTDTTAGKVKGIISVSREGNEFYEWLGIPYGKADRFSTPKPTDKWKGVRDASEYGPVCAQFEMFSDKFIGQEDCLFLNVHAPKTTEEEKLLPVLVWIHGGYFYTGSSNMYRPEYLVDENVILVTINYRLGALGFLNTEDEVVRGNMGLKDQALAMKWINENIDKFGGDKRKVVLFGESAGGASTHYHMFSPMSRGLFSKVISQSGTVISPWALFEEPLEQAKEFATSLNCPFSGSTREMVECLRQVDIEKLVQAHKPGLELFHSKSKVFVPTVEKVIDEETFLGEDPLKLIESGEYTQIPWMVGSLSSEGLISAHNFLKNESFRSHLQNNWEDFVESFLAQTPTMANRNGQKIRNFYFGTDGRLDNLDAFDQVTNVIGDAMFLAPAVTAAQLQAKGGRSRVYLYYYNKKGPSIFNFLLSIQNKLPIIIEVIIEVITSWVKANILGIHPHHYGACHADELAMSVYLSLFKVPNFFEIGVESEHFQFSKDVVKLWVDFVYDDESMKFRNEPFLKLDPQNNILKVFEINDKAGIREAPEQVKAAVKFWNSLETEQNVN